MLTAGPTPQIPLSEWTFALNGLVESPVQWAWEQFNDLPQQTFIKDIHCVTKWTKLDTQWDGVSVDTLLEHVTLKPQARFVMAYSHGGYTTNIPLDDLRGGKAFVGLLFDGQPLAPEHGGPVSGWRKLGARGASVLVIFSILFLKSVSPEEQLFVRGRKPRSATQGAGLAPSNKRISRSA